MLLNWFQKHTTEYLGRSSVKYYFLDQIYKILFLSDIDIYARLSPHFLWFGVYIFAFLLVESPLAVFQNCIGRRRTHFQKLFEASIL